MDPLEDVLSVIGTTSYLSTRMEAGGDWALRFEPPSWVKFNSVRRGSCWLQVDGVPQPLFLHEGDCFLLTRPRAFTLASDLARPAFGAPAVFANTVDGVARTGQGDDVLLIGGGFTFNDRARSVLLANLPPVLHVPAHESSAATIHWALDRIETEVLTKALGSASITRHLALIMLVDVLRLHLSQRPGDVSGWLAGLADPPVATALRAMHARPGHPWTVAELAARSAVSRSTLAARFKRVVGQGPLEYLTGWRIELASARLRQGPETLDRIAREVGYGSESALSTAFSRVTGMSPREYRRRNAPSVPASSI